jgi:hypothetical protein
MRVKPLLYTAGAACVLACATLFGAAASAAPAPDLHGRDYQSFSTEEKTLWQSGKWVHNWHDGHYAWYWAVGDVWYYYKAPVFPAPNTVASVAVTGSPAPVVDGASAGPSWFYCDKPAGNTPAIGACDGTWQQVVVAPAASEVAMN